MGSLFTGEQKEKKPPRSHIHAPILPFPPPGSVLTLRAWAHPPNHSPMLYFCCTSRTTWVLADLRKIPSVVRAGKQWGLVSLGSGAYRCLDPLGLGAPRRVGVGADARGALSPAWQLPEGSWETGLRRGLGSGLKGKGQILEALWPVSSLGTHRRPAGRLWSPEAQAERAPALGSSPGGCWERAVSRACRPPEPSHTRPAHLSHTHCCSETPNCWLGRGGRGGMGLGAVAGLFCVDLRKSSYLGEADGRVRPPT